MGRVSIFLPLRYTFADVLAWDEKERVEIINGAAVMMAPSRVRQEASGERFGLLRDYLRDKRRRLRSLPRLRSQRPCFDWLEGSALPSDRCRWN